MTAIGRVNLDRLNQWLTLLANFGVVAGIVFLAVEIRQNQALLEQNQQTAHGSLPTASPMRGV